MPDMRCSAKRERVPKSEDKEPDAEKVSLAAVPSALPFDIKTIAAGAIGVALLTGIAIWSFSGPSSETSVSGVQQKDGEKTEEPEKKPEEKTEAEAKDDTPAADEPEKKTESDEPEKIEKAENEDKPDIQKPDDPPAKTRNRSR